jgi:hypothetical protein
MADCISFPALFVNSCDWGDLPAEKVEKLSFMVNTLAQGPLDGRDLLYCNYYGNEQPDADPTYVDAWRQWLYFSAFCCSLFAFLRTFCDESGSEFATALGLVCRSLPIKHPYIVSTFVRLMVNIFCRIEDGGKTHELWIYKDSILMMLAIIVQPFPQIFEDFAGRPFPEECRRSLNNWRAERPENQFQSKFKVEQATPQEAVQRLVAAFNDKRAQGLMMGFLGPFDKNVPTIEIRPSYREFLSVRFVRKKISL